MMAFLDVKRVPIEGEEVGCISLSLSKVARAWVRRSGLLRELTCQIPSYSPTATRPTQVNLKLDGVLKDRNQRCVTIKLFKRQGVRVEISTAFVWFAAAILQLPLFKSGVSLPRSRPRTAMATSNTWA